MGADVLVPDGMRRCAASHHVGERVLPVTDFYVVRKEGGRLQSHCKECMRRRSAVQRKELWAGHVQVRASGDDPKPENDVEEDEPEEKDDPERWVRIRMWAAYERAGGRTVGMTRQWDHVVDELELARWCNEVAAEIRAGRSLDEAMTIANEDHALEGEELPIGVEGAARRDLTRARPLEGLSERPQPTQLAIEEDDLDSHVRLQGAEFEKGKGVEPLPLWKRALSERGQRPRRHVARVLHLIPKSPIARARGTGDGQTVDDLALELAGVTERQLDATAPETAHLDPEARLGRIERRLLPRPPRRRSASIPQFYCPLCRAWGLHRRIDCPKREPVAVSHPGEDVCFYCVKAPPTCRVNGELACDLCRDSVVASASRPERMAKTVETLPPTPASLEERILEVLARCRMPASGLAYELDLTTDEVERLLRGLKFDGRVHPLTIGGRRHWSLGGKP